MSKAANLAAINQLLSTTADVTFGSLISTGSTDSFAGCDFARGVG